MWQNNTTRSLSSSKVLKPDEAQHLLGSLLPDMVQLALRASELCTKVTAITNQRHCLTAAGRSGSQQWVDPKGHNVTESPLTWQ